MAIGIADLVVAAWNAVDRLSSVSTNWVLGGTCLLPVAAVLTAAAGAAAPAPSETLMPLLQQPMPNVPGKTLTAVGVAFPPGARSTPHRHGGAFLYAYVLDGDVRSQIEGQPVRTYHTGDSWTEKPGDHHVLTENISSSKPARLPRRVRLG